MKDEFIALVSHELRTPLTSICGYLELLLHDDVMAELPDVQLNWLEVIDRNAERLLRLVEDLLLTAQASAGNLALEKAELDVAAVVAQAVQAGTPVAAARGISLTCSTEPLPPANGDRLRIGQVIDNLVSNALKFTPAGGTVDVRAYPHRSAVRIEVTDTGMGISEDEQAQLFERFFRTARAQERGDPRRRARALDLEGDRRGARRADLRPKRRGSRHDVLRRPARRRPAPAGCFSSLTRCAHCEAGRVTRHRAATTRPRRSSA